MTLLSVSGYSVTDLAAALHSSRRHVSFRYDILSSANDYLRPAKSVAHGVVENNALATIKRTAKFQFEDDTELDWVSERLRPWYRLRMPDGGYAEWPMGVFLLSTPARSVRATSTTREVEAYDQLLIVSEDRVLSRYTVSAGVTYTAAARTLLQSTAGISTYSIPEDSKTLPVPREWEPGTSKLRVINDLLSSAGYESLSVSEAGVPYSRVYRNPSDRGIDYQYIADGKSVIAPDVEVELDLFSVPNVFVGIVSEPDRPPLRSEYRNQNSLSPTSTVRRGRDIVEVIPDMEAADQLTLDLLVQRRAFNASQVYETMKLKTRGMPFHGNLDIVSLDYGSVGPKATYAESGWTLPLKAGAMMEHVIRRVVPV